MRGVVLLLAIAACDADRTRLTPVDDHPDARPTPDAPGQNFDGMEIVIDQARIRAFVYWDSAPGHFAPPSTCITVGDVIYEVATCLANVAIDGTSIDRSSDNIYTLEQDALPMNATLHLEGCGASVALPLHNGSGPALTATATSVVDEQQQRAFTSATWQAPDAASVLVQEVDGLGSDICHVVGASTYTFENGLYPNYVEVTALAPPVATDTAFGTVRVWNGTRRHIEIPPL